MNREKILARKRPYSGGEQTVCTSGMRAAHPAHQLAAPRHWAHDFDITGWVFSSFNCSNVSRGFFKVETEGSLACGQPSIRVDTGMVGAAPTGGQDSCPLGSRRRREAGRREGTWNPSAAPGGASWKHPYLLQRKSWSFTPPSSPAVQSLKTKTNELLN